MERKTISYNHLIGKSKLNESNSLFKAIGDE